MSEELDVIDDELLAAIAKVKGLAVQKAEPRPLSELYPLSAANKVARAKAQEKALEHLEDFRPGNKLPDGTIYLGKYSPIGCDGNSLNLEFNVLVAKEDLPDGPRTYVDTVEYISGLKDWNGYGGASYANDAEFYTALKNGTYDGKWIIPTNDILCGKHADWEIKTSTSDNMLAHKKDGAFSGTFNVSAGSSRNIDPTCYWGCSELPCHEDNVSRLSFHGDKVDWVGKASISHSCRVVRLVPCK